MVHCKKKLLQVSRTNNRCVDVLITGTVYHRSSTHKLKLFPSGVKLY